ncbi:MAG: RcpC/CpaB family pilus assembly protein [Actinomycetota bacterium]
MSKKSNPAVWLGLAVAIVGALVVFAYAGGGMGGDDKADLRVAGAAEAVTGGLDVPPGTNAVSVNAPVPQGMAHYAGAEAMVNVYANYKGNGPGSEALTKLILTNVKVLANRPAGDAKTPGVAGSTGEIVLTLALSAPDSEKLIHAKENGTVWFGLARPGEPPATTGGVTSKTAVR